MPEHRPGSRTLATSPTGEPPFEFTDKSGTTLTIHGDGLIEIANPVEDRYAAYTADPPDLAGIADTLIGVTQRRPRRKGYNGTGIPCRAADLEGRVGERLEIEVYDNVTTGKTVTIIGVLDSVDDLTAMVSPLWSPWQVSINVHDIANVWTAEPR